MLQLFIFYLRYIDGILRAIVHEVGDYEQRYMYELHEHPIVTRITTTCLGRYPVPGTQAICCSILKLHVLIVYKW